jgi:hypothetical protein
MGRLARNLDLIFQWLFSVPGTCCLPGTCRLGPVSNDIPYERFNPASDSPPPARVAHDKAFPPVDNNGGPL